MLAAVAGAVLVLAGLQLATGGLRAQHKSESLARQSAQAGAGQVANTPRYTIAMITHETPG